MSDSPVNLDDPVALADMAFLSAAAYPDKLPANLSLFDTLQANDWTLLDEGDLPRPPSASNFLFWSAYFGEGEVEGYYAHFSSQAFVATKGTTLALTFRGTDNLQTDIPGALNQSALYENFEQLIDSIELYLDTPGGSIINEIYVAGHSLGGIMAEIFAVEDAVRFSQPMSIVNFGSPGIDPREYPSTTFESTEIIHFYNTGDLIPKLADLFPNQFVYRGTEFPIDLQTINDGLNEHEMLLYQASLEALENSEYANRISNDTDIIIGKSEKLNVLSTTNTNFSDSLSGPGNTPKFILGLGGDDTIAAGNGNDIIEGGTGSDIIFAFTGNDILVGGSGTDRLKGGEGNDTLNGGSGTDTAVFNYSWQQYTLLEGGGTRNFQIRDEVGDDGLDTLIDIERLQFSDRTFSSVSSYFAEHQPEQPVAPEARPEPDPVSNLPGLSPSGLPYLIGNGLSISEGDSGSRQAVFTFNLTRRTDSPVTFTYALTGGSGYGKATSGVDFEFNAEFLSIPAGAVSIDIPVTIFGDTKVEPNETFTIIVGNVSGAELASGGLINTYTGVIRDDDRQSAPEPEPAPDPVTPAGPVYLTLRANDVSQVEGPNGTITEYDFTLRKTGDFSVDTKVGYVVSGFGASPASPDDFVGGVFPSSNDIIRAGETQDRFTVRVMGDATMEAHEYFKVTAYARSPGVTVTDDTAFATILNDDGTTLPSPAGDVFVSIRAVDAEKFEGTDANSSGSANSATNFVYELIRSGNLNQQTSVKVSVSTGEGTTPQSNRSDTEWGSSSFTRTFEIGQSNILLNVPVRADAFNEPDEPLIARVRTASGSDNVTIADGRAEGLIRNDDGPAPPLLTAAPIVVRETDLDQTVFFRVDLSSTTSAPISLNYEIYSFSNSDHPSTEGNDFIPATGVLNIAAGAAFGVIPVTIKGDNLSEAIEVVDIRLEDPVNGFFGRSIDTWDTGIIILDDESPDAFPALVSDINDRAIELGTFSPYTISDIFYQFDENRSNQIFKFSIDEPMSFAVFGDRPEFIFDGDGELIFADTSRFDIIKIADIQNGLARGASFQPGDYFFLIEQKENQANGPYSFELHGLPLPGDDPMVQIDTIGFS